MQDAGWLQAAHRLHRCLHRACHQLHSTHLERADQDWDDKRRHCPLDPWEQCWAGSKIGDCMCGCFAAGVVVGVLDHADERRQGCTCDRLPALWCACQDGNHNRRTPSCVVVVLSLHPSSLSRSAARLPTMQGRLISMWCVLHEAADPTACRDHGTASRPGQPLLPSTKYVHAAWLIPDQHAPGKCTVRLGPADWMNSVRRDAGSNMLRPMPPAVTPTTDHHLQQGHQGGQSSHDTLLEPRLYGQPVKGLHCLCLSARIGRVLHVSALSAGQTASPTTQHSVLVSCCVLEAQCQDSSSPAAVEGAHGMLDQLQIVDARLPQP